jgi:hypothetical protein
MGGSQGQRQLIGTGIADMLRYMDTYIWVRDSRHRQGAQYFQACNENVAAIRVLAHVGDLFHHVGHGAAFSGAHAMMAMWTRNADNSHLGFRSARDKAGQLLLDGLIAFVLLQTEDAENAHHGGA